MSRTTKDKPWKHQRDRFSQYGDKLHGAPKKPRELDTEHHWMTTPGWWVRLWMTRPERVRVHQLEHLASTMSVTELEDLDIPDLGKKPHKYFW